MKLAIVIFSVAVCFESATPKSLPPQNQAKCGVPAIKPDTSSNIYGGKNAIPHSWPWQVAVSYKAHGGLGQSFHCGGTLLSNQWVMTSARALRWSNATAFVVTVGVFNISRDDEPGERTVNVMERHDHPKYNDDNGDYDVALLKLEEPIQFSDSVSPICLPAQDEALPEAGTPVFLIGWGYEEPNNKSWGEVSETLKQVSVQVISKEKCKASWSGIDETVKFCTGLDEGGKEACYADGGGPVMFQDPANSGAWKQLGITSMFSSCAKPRSYGLKSKVSAYIDFIKQYVTDI